MARVVLSLLSVLLLLSVAASAQQMISGVIADSAGRPIANARVAFAGIDSALMTAADGAYAYCCLPESARLMRVTASGYDGVIARIPELSGEHVDFRLFPADLHAKGATLVGDVLDRDGRPIALATARISGTKLGGFSTEPLGEFIIPDAPFGARTIDISAVGFEPAHVQVLVDSVGVQWLLPVRLDYKGGVPVSELDREISPAPSLPDPTVRRISAEELNRSAHTSIFSVGDR